MVVKAIQSFDEYKTIIASGKPVVIDFWATWCGPCKVISPVFEKLSETVEGVEYYKVDVDEHGAVAQAAGVKAMPTFALFKDGQKVDTVVGAIPSALQSLINQGASLA